MFDYQSVLTVRSPPSEREKIRVGPWWLNAAQCPLCGDYLRSVNRHDFRTCSCGAVSVDGGSWYLKRVGLDWVELSIPFDL